MKRGFTLIELLVVISIISLLSSILLVSLQEARARARNSKRVQDLVQLRNALELYKLDNGQYPVPVSPGLGNNSAGVSCWDCFGNFSGYSLLVDTERLDEIATYLPTRPNDPRLILEGATSFVGYWYKVNSVGSDYKLSLVGTVEGASGVPGSFSYPSGIPRTMQEQNYYFNYYAISVYSSETSRTWNWNDPV